MEDFLGMVASLLVMVSFIPKNILLIRILNLIGSVFFIVYGILINATWTTFTNCCLLGINCYWIVKLVKERK